MSFFEQGKLSQFMRDSRTGLWKVEFYATSTPRFYADEVMDELLGITWETTPEERYLFHYSHIHPDDLEMFEQYSAELLENSAEVTYRYLHPTYGEQYVRCSGTRDFSITDCWCILGMHKDISDTLRLEKDKIAEFRLAEENRQLKYLQNYSEKLFGQIMKLQTSGVVCYKFPSHDVLVMNDVAKGLFEIPVDNVVSREEVEYLFAHTVYDYPEETLPKLHQMAETREAVSYTIRIPKRDGSFLPVWIVSQIIDLPDGSQAVISSLQDISQLTEVQEANEAKKRFLFSMSHDIRTPMNAIIGYTDLIEKNLGDIDKCRDYIQKVRSSSGFLLSLINDVLEMARIESGKVTLDESTWSMEQFVDTLFSVFDGQMKDKNIHFTRKIDVKTPYVKCDPIKLREIFLNIMSNALKYTPEGGTITLEVHELPSTRLGYVCLETVVADTGIGMSEEFLPKIFEEFSREENTTESKIEGTGLGMPIVKKLVELMGGTIQVESELGKGTKFTVRIDHEISSKEAMVKQQVVDVKEADFRGKRILLAEDNDLNAEIAMEVLAESGFEVERAEDGAVCVEMLKTGPHYDLILMDIQMPNMNGYEATRAIRSLPEQKLAQIPIIAMTANAFEEDRREAMEAGMNEHVAKPVDVKLLLKTLSQILGKTVE